jgi:DNA-directed RNA polymerase specialized sigma24 family protein
MQEHVSAIPPLWISDTDEHGNRVSREVIDAGHRIWRRVLQYVQSEGQDAAPAAEVLEKTCHCVSRALRRGSVIRNLDAYLYCAFVRRFVRRVIHEDKIQYVESVEAFADAKLGPDYGWVSMVENEILFKQFLSFLDAKTRLMVFLRHRGDSWAEIGKRFGISGHNAEVQFAKAVRKARERVFGKVTEKTGREKQ